MSIGPEILQSHNQRIIGQEDGTIQNQARRCPRTLLASPSMLSSRKNHRTIQYLPFGTWQNHALSDPDPPQEADATAEERAQRDAELTRCYVLYDDDDDDDDDELLYVIPGN